MSGLNRAKQIADVGLSFEIISKSKLFPPLNILNDFLEFGIDDLEFEVNIQWPSFTLSEVEYLEFYEYCCQKFGELKITNENESQNFSTWFSSAVTQ